MTATIAPHSPEAEISVLGACLQDAQAAKTACELLTPGDFFDATRAEVFGIVRDLATRGTPPDLVTVCQAAIDRKATDRITATLLHDLVEKTPTAANVAHHANIVKEKAALRRIMDACTRTAEKAKTGSDPGDLVAALREELDSVRTTQAGNRAPLVRANEICAEPLSYCVGEILPQGMLTILSGKDKRGKTLLAIEMVKAVLLQQSFLKSFVVAGGGPVACYLVDDPDVLTIDRLKKLGIYEHPDLYLATKSKVDLWDASAVLADMAAEVKRVKARFVLVDALYLFIPPGKDSGNDGSRMRPVMLALDRLSEETGATVLLIAHDTKAGLDVAGSYVIRACAKAILRLELPKREADEDEDGPETPKRVLRAETKMAPAQAWTLEILGTRDNYQGWRCHGTTREARASDTLNAVRAFLADGRSGTAEEISKKIERRKEDVIDAVKVLEASGEAVGEPRKGGAKGRPALVYRAPDFRSQGDFRSEGRERNSEQQPLELPVVAGAEDFRSRVSPPREPERDGNSSEAPAEVEAWEL